VGTVGTGVLAGRLWALFAFGTIASAAAWSLSTLLPGWVSQIAGASERGRVLGWVHLWWNMAMMLGALLGGGLYERAVGLPFLVSGAVNVLSIGLAVAFYRVAAENYGPVPSEGTGP